jgi:hypothetical protein
LGAPAEADQVKVVHAILRSRDIRDIRSILTMTFIVGLPEIHEIRSETNERSRFYGDFFKLDCL